MMIYGPKLVRIVAKRLELWTGASSTKFVSASTWLFIGVLLNFATSVITIAFYENSVAKVDFNTYDELLRKLADGRRKMVLAKGNLSYSKYVF